MLDLEEGALDLEELDRPLFVYGTLRPRMGNASLWEECGATPYADGWALVYGWEMRASGVPYAIRTHDDDDSIIGCLIYPPEDLELQIRLRWVIDSLEGHPYAYVRTRVKAWIPHLRTQVDAWMYDASGFAKHRGVRVPSGDYYDYRR